MSKPMAAVTTHRAAGLPRCGAFLHVLPGAQYDSPSAVEKWEQIFLSLPGLWRNIPFLFFESN
jgi:hypothetical protein